MNDQNTKTKENIEYVKGKLQPAEILAQLAEEAAELGQAALKLRRAILGTNPTSVSEEEAKIPAPCRIWGCKKLLESLVRSWTGRNGHHGRRACGGKVHPVGRETQSSRQETYYRGSS